jgi:hypothetical protein
MKDGIYLISIELNRYYISEIFSLIYTGINTDTLSESARKISSYARERSHKQNI